MNLRGRLMKIRTDRHWLRSRLWPCCAWLAVATVVQAQPARDGALMGASAEKHAWIVADSAQVRGQYELFHAMPGPDGGYAAPLFTLRNKPGVMAAWGDRVWLVDPADASLRRRVMTTRMIRNPTTGLYSTDPPKRMELAPSLDGLGVLAGAVGTEEGLVVLLAPPQFAEREVVRTPPVPTDPVLRVPRLLRLEGLEWIELELPESVRVAHDSRLAGGGANGALIILTPAAVRVASIEVYIQQFDGDWSRSTVDLNVRDIRSFTNAGNHTLLARSIVEADAPPRVELDYLRPEGLASVLQFNQPKTPFTTLATSDGIQVYIQPRPGSLAVRYAGLLDGRLSDPIELGPPSASKYIWYGSLLFALALGTVFFVLIARPAAQVVVLPEHTALLGPFSRMTAMAIDFSPAAILALLLTGAPLEHLINLPITTMQPADAYAYAVASCLAVAHAATSELVWRTTLGKWLMGGCVVGINGDRAKVGQVLARNGVKLLILLMPPLAIIMVLNRNFQGLNDMIAKTVVVRHVPANSDEGERVP